MRFKGQTSRYKRKKRSENVCACAWTEIAVGHRTFYYRAVQLWNDLCPELNLSMTIKDFKRKLNQMLTFKVFVQDCLIFADQLILRPTKRLKENTFLMQASQFTRSFCLPTIRPELEYDLRSSAQPKKHDGASWQPAAAYRRNHWSHLHTVLFHFSGPGGVL